MTASYVTTANLKVRLNIGTADTTDDALLDTIVEQVNSYVEFVTRREVGPTTGGTATFDADEDVWDGQLYVRDGVRAITSLTVAPSTGETAGTATTSDLVILPREQNRRPGWPGFYVLFKPVVTGPVNNWGVGYGGITMVYDGGWAAIPPELVEVAEVTATRAWRGRKSGQEDIIGTDETGQPVISRFVSGRDRKTLMAFRPDRIPVG